jgi:hypothetical protein
VRQILADADRLVEGNFACPCEGCQARGQLRRFVHDLAGAVSEAQASAAFLAGQLEYERVAFALALQRAQDGRAPVAVRPSLRDVLAGEQTVGDPGD